MEERDRGLIGRVAGRVTGRVVDTVDPDLVLDHVNVDALLDRIDLDRHLERVDVNALLDRVDVNRILDRVDLTRLLDRVDVNRLLDGVDVNRLLDRADVDALVRRSGVPDLVAESTGRVAGTALDAARRQVVGVDTLLDRTLDRLFRRAGVRPEGPPALLDDAQTIATVTGHYAGPLSRAAAAAVDTTIISALFTAGYAGTNQLLQAFFGRSLSGDWSAPFAAVSLALWAFSYVFVSLAVAGRTAGKGLVGLRVVHHSGRPVGVWQAFVRTLMQPVSAAVLGIGLLLIVVQRDHRALHDLVARTAVVYDWGERAVQLSAPLADFLQRHIEKP